METFIESEFQNIFMGDFYFKSVNFRFFYNAYFTKSDRKPGTQTKLSEDDCNKLNGSSLEKSESKKTN